LYLKQYDGLDASIAAIDRRVDASVARLDEEAKAPTQVLAQEQAGQCPFRSLIELLCMIPGISVLGATVILSEIGRDMSRFPTAGHLVAWAGLCPGQNESAGKRRSSRLRKGAPG
jgi:transposase